MDFSNKKKPFQGKAARITCNNNNYVTTSNKKINVIFKYNLTKNIIIYTHYFNLSLFDTLSKDT